MTYIEFEVTLTNGVAYVYADSYVVDVNGYFFFRGDGICKSFSKSQVVSVRRTNG